MRRKSVTSEMIKSYIVEAYIKKPSQGSTGKAEVITKPAGRIGWRKENECWVVVKRGRPIDDKTFWYIDAVEEAM